MVDRLHTVRWDDIGDVPVRSLRAGRDQAPSVVVVPGLGALGYLVDALHGCGASAATALLDVPGFGHRPPWPCAPEVPAIAETVADWLRVVADGPVTLVGHSTGAQAALRVAMDHPDLVGSLVLLGPTFPPALRRAPALVRAFLVDSRREPPGLLRATAPYYARAGVGSLRRFVGSAQRDEPERWITEVRCPVLVGRGEHDALSPEPWARALADAAPEGRLVTVAGAHTFPYQHGGATAALIGQAVPHTWDAAEDRP